MKSSTAPLITFILWNTLMKKYMYRAGAFSGVRSFSGVETGGSRVCSVFACTGVTMDTCGRRFGTYTVNSTAHFEELSIAATFPTPVIEMDLHATDSAVFPVAMKTSIMPLEPEDYTHEVTNEGSNTIFDLKLVNIDEELYSFGVWGRVFASDGQDADPAVLEEAQPEIPEVEGSTGAAVMSTMSRLLLVPVSILVFGLSGF